MSSTRTPTRRMVRRTDDRVIAGVASGLADLLGLDPVLVRIGFVVLAFAGGAGIILYGALWLLTPEVEGGATHVNADRGAGFWIAIGLFVLAALALADAVADRSVVWPLVLVGAGVALWRSDRGGRPAPPPGAGPSTPPPPPASSPVSPHDPTREVTAPVPAWTPPPAPTARATAPVAPGGPSDPQTPVPGPEGEGWTPPPAHRRDRSILGRLTIGVALLAVGTLAVLDATDVLDVAVRDGFAVALLVLGLGLVVGTWVGRARWLAVPALVLVLPGLLISSVFHDLDVPLSAGIGERTVGVTGVADVDPTYEVGIGQLLLDLGALDLDGQDVATDVHLGFGQIQIVVPDDVRVEIDWDVAGGQVSLPDRSDRSGRALEGSEVLPGEEGAGTLDLDIELAFGQVEVFRASDRPFRETPGDNFDGIQFGTRSRR